MWHFLNLGVRGLRSHVRNEDLRLNAAGESDRANLRILQLKATGAGYRTFTMYKKKSNPEGKGKFLDDVHEQGDFLDVIRMSGIVEASVEGAKVE